MCIFYIILCIFIPIIPILCKSKKKNKIVPQKILYINPIHIEITETI